MLSLAKKKKTTHPNDGHTNEDNGMARKESRPRDSDTSDSDDDWSAKAGKAKRKKMAPNKRNKRKMTRSSSEDSDSDKDVTAKVSEPEEGMRLSPIINIVDASFIIYLIAFKNP